MDASHVVSGRFRVEDTLIVGDRVHKVSWVVRPDGTMIHKEDVRDATNYGVAARGWFLHRRDGGESDDSMGDER